MGYKRNKIAVVGTLNFTVVINFMTDEVSRNFTCCFSFVLCHWSRATAYHLSKVLKKHVKSNIKFHVFLCRFIWHTFGIFLEYDLVYLLQ